MAPSSTLANRLTWPDNDGARWSPHTADTPPSGISGPRAGAVARTRASAVRDRPAREREPRVRPRTALRAHGTSALRRRASRVEHLRRLLPARARRGLSVRPRRVAVALAEASSRRPDRGDARRAARAADAARARVDAARGVGGRARPAAPADRVGRAAVLCRVHHRAAAPALV